MVGKTSSGFDFEVNESITDDWEFIEDMAAGTAVAEVRAAERVLGDKQYKKLKDHVRDKDGRVSFKAMTRSLARLSQPQEQKTPDPRRDAERRTGFARLRSGRDVSRSANGGVPCPSHRNACDGAWRRISHTKADGRPEAVKRR